MLFLLLQVATAQPAAPTLKWDAIVDVYADAGSPQAPGGIRTWMTQPREDRSFALNLAAIGATWTADRVHARFAVQSGSSVVANYAGEPDPTGVRMIEEAYVGARAAEGLWIDAGIFYSAIGMESWRSTDNATYTRSLTADYTPYYSAGVRGIWQASPTLALRLDLINGWQRIGENNDAKALSARADWTPHERLLVGGSAFVGNERP
ncbi:MAG TPA: porin, partial [Gemmatimonadales bacterium]|nr:porin [Gemmatimonadales bacterium]